jgi:lipoprotein
MMGFGKRLCIIFGTAAVCAVICITAACTSKTDGTSGTKDSSLVLHNGDPVNDPNGGQTYNRAEVYRDSTLGATVVYANDAANGVQGYYEEGSRDHYVLENSQIQLSQSLTGYQNKRIAYLKNAETGSTYFENTMEPYIKTKDGSVYYAGNSQTNGRMNTTRLGYYYYETHIRDLDFGKELSASANEYLYTADISGFSGSTWTTNDMNKPAYSEGIMSVQVMDTYDPYVFRRGLNIPEDRYNAIEVTLKTNGASKTGELFFYTDRTGGFNAEQRIPFSINDDGQYHTYVIPLSNAGQTGGILRGIRFDIGTSVGETITFQSIRAIKMNYTSVPFKLDKTFHTYPDKLHQEYRIIATAAASGIEEYGLEVRFPAEKVASFAVKFGNSLQSDYGEFYGGEVRFAAFDIKDAGMIGFIIPYDGLTKRVSVTLEGDFVVFRQIAVLPSNIPSGSEIKFGNRLYTDAGHSYSEIEKQAEIERNPLDVTVSNNSSSGCRYIGYDHMRGAYHFILNGSDFNKAYYIEPDKHYLADIQMNGDDHDRTAYIWMNSTGGCLEGAAILDDQKMQVPIPVEVCKNFCGEMEEPFYDPTDTQYGDSFYPIRIEARKSVKHTSIQLYQNWGKFPLKQISSIQFHISYYHLSTGVTESNCIAPYFVYGKDEWTLPDFRGCSGNMWDSQPQFNAVGRLRFVSYQTNAGKIKSEYTGTEIRSAGPVYADMDYNYISDCGSYEYSLRHLEFPQNDENRTYYTLELTFLKDLEIKNVKENFTLFSMDGRAAAFRKLSYLNSDGAAVYKNLDLSRTFAETLVLGKDTPYFSYYGLGAAGASIMNFAYIVKNYDITLSGEKWNGNFVLRNTYDGHLNYAYISLNEGDMTFRKGDSIKINFILLPWGDHNDTADANVRYVREDSVLHPLTINVLQGKAIEDDYLPTVRAESNLAEFTLTGGRNCNAVRIDGFTKFGTPVIYEVKNGVEVLYNPSKYAYDGYAIHYNEDGTYGYSFLYQMDSPEQQRTFRIEIR